jgi:hypothetical protein
MTDCPPLKPGVGGAQTDLNAPPTSPPLQTYVQASNLNQLHTLCQYGMSPSLTTSVLMVVVSAHFGNPNLIFTDNLKQYTWTNDATTKIRIVQNTHFDPTVAGLLPAVVFARGAQASQRLVINDQMPVDTREQALGIGRHVRMMVGTHRIMCIAAADRESEDLALEVFDVLTFLSPILRSQGYPFNQFEVTSLGQLGVLEDMGNVIGVPIDVSYAYAYGWAVQPLAPTLKAINFNITDK